MSGDWGNVDCPQCGARQPRPDAAAATNDDELLAVRLTCADCGTAWEHGVEIWRYYGVPEHLPSRDEDV
jgi:hypothetical protein